MSLLWNMLSMLVITFPPRSKRLFILWLQSPSAVILEPRERTRAGLEVARQLGRKGGRKPKMTDSKIESAKKLLASGVPPKDVARNLGVSIPTLYRWVPASAHA